MGTIVEGPVDEGDDVSEEKPMEDSEEDPASLTEDELYMGLIEVLAEDTTPVGTAPTAASISELDRCIQVLTFERDQARALMQTALASKDAAIVARDSAFAARDVFVSDHDAHRAYADEVIGQARRILET